MSTEAELVAHRRRTLRGNRAEDRLHVGGRLRDHAQDLAGCRLLIQRLGQVAVLGPKLREESGVLDRDHGLVGEGLEQPDLG